MQRKPLFTVLHHSTEQHLCEENVCKQQFIWKHFVLQEPSTRDFSRSGEGRCQNYSRNTWTTYEFRQFGKNRKISDATSGTHGGKYEHGFLLSFSAMKSGTRLPTFQKRLLPPSLVTSKLALITEASNTPETQVNLYQITRRVNPEGSHLQILRSLSPFPGLASY
jgi:hypothetical protein